MNPLNQTSEHPTNEELAAFALGKKTTWDNAIAEHVANCAWCETLVAETPPDTFFDILNKAKLGSHLAEPYVPNTGVSIVDELPEEMRKQTKYTFLRKLGGGAMGWSISPNTIS